jgi:hypothetical protein
VDNDTVQFVDIWCTVSDCPDWTSERATVRVRRFDVTPTPSPAPTPTHGPVGWVIGMAGR